jgi:4-diphosphocytidyl-2-C-methyl-D-erythritol kinase
MILEMLRENGSGLEIRGRVPCKLNLFLEVLDRRPDGYHNLETIMLAVDLCDEVEIAATDDDPIQLDVGFADPQMFDEHDPAWRIPSDPSNLVTKALSRLRDRLGTSEGAVVKLRKRIPAQAGLGGGSADAAAALVLGSLAWTANLDWPTICDVASELGSDVNFFLEGWNGSNWTAKCLGRGERVIPIPNPANQHVVIVHPPRGCDTGTVFRGLAAAGPSWTEPRRSSEEMQNLLSCGANERIARMLYNRLELPAGQCTDWIDRSARRFDRYKPLGHCLTGSGSARFCLCSTPAEAEKIASELQSFRDFRVYTASTWGSPSIQEQARRLGFVA